MKTNVLSRYFCVFLALMLTVTCLLSSCGGTGNVTDTSDSVADTSMAETAPETTTPPDVISGGKGIFTVIRPEKMTDPEIKNIQFFIRSIENKTGVKLGIKDDWIAPGEEETVLTAPEILIGLTNRAESQQVYDTLGENSYTVTRLGNKIVILGKDANCTALAMQDFLTKVAGSDAHASDGKLVFGENDTVNGTSPDGQKLNLAALIEGGLNFTALSKEVLHCAPQGECKVTQGCAYDGKYAYFVLRNGTDSATVICKYDLDTKALIKVSDNLPLGHGSDMTYDADIGQLVVAHGNNEGKILTFVNPETLAFIRNVNIAKGAGAITYNKELKLYAIGQGGTSLHFLRATSFAPTFSLDRKQTDNAVADGYITQGLGSDSKYLYFPMNMTGNTENILVAYDWSGKFITRITIPVAMESESMFFTDDGECYISFYKGQNGAFLHKVDFYLTLG